MTAGLPERLVLRFGDDRSRGEIADQVRAVVEARIIQVVDLAIVRKDRDGDATVSQVTDRSDDPFRSLVPLIAAPMGTWVGRDVTRAVGEVPNGTAALVVVFEHRWAERLSAIWSGADMGGAGA